MSEEKKYEILPGVELPDLKSIHDAASDFSVSGVNEIQIKSPKPSYAADGSPVDSATAAELAALQELGDQVAADEARAAADSRRRMDAILATAVQQPESIIDLLNYNRDKVSEETIRQKEEELKKAADLQAALEEKERAREERRQLQQRLLQEARERAATMREAEKRGIKADESLLDKKAEAEAEEAKAAVEDTVAEDAVAAEVAEVSDVAEEPVQEAAKEIEPAEEETAPVAEKKPEMSVRKPLAAPSEPVKPSIASAEETFDDFSEFLDGNK